MYLSNGRLWINTAMDQLLAYLFVQLHAVSKTPEMALKQSSNKVDTFYFIVLL
jgi:hypothetical protein